MDTQKPTLAEQGGGGALDDSVEDLLEELLDQAVGSGSDEQLRRIFTTAVELASAGADRLDLKIMSGALSEMAAAFRMFAPYRGVRKLTIFGSARTRRDDPLYDQARRLAQRFAEAGWMIVTGAGPGIMEAGLEGAGRERAIGVNIRLPFEQRVSKHIAKDPKLVHMRYFFTRKLMLVKESHAFCFLPGGFGTQDEAFELLTLVQTGKAEPAPIVLLDFPGGSYWSGWERFVDAELARAGYIAPEDRSLYRITDDVERAFGELIGFYRNYHSMRFVGPDLVLRVQRLPTEERIEELSVRFADIAPSGLRSGAPLPVEVAEGDVPELGRVLLRFDRRHYGRLRQLIDALNDEAGLVAEP